MLDLNAEERRNLDYDREWMDHLELCNLCKGRTFWGQPFRRGDCPLWKQWRGPTPWQTVDRDPRE